MANYLPHYTKKKQLLARKELELQRRISRSEPIERVLDAAQHVRDARIRVLQARRATIVPKGDADAQYRKIDDQIEQLSRTSLDLILAEFEYSVAEEDAS